MKRAEFFGTLRKEFALSSDERVHFTEVTKSNVKFNNVTWSLCSSEFPASRSGRGTSGSFSCELRVDEPLLYCMIEDNFHLSDDPDLPYKNSLQALLEVFHAKCFGWSTVRLLLLARKKNVGPDCPISWLPMDMVKKISRTRFFWPPFVPLEEHCLKVIHYGRTYNIIGFSGRALHVVHVDPTMKKNQLNRWFSMPLQPFLKHVEENLNEFLKQQNDDDDL